METGATAARVGVLESARRTPRRPPGIDPAAPWEPIKIGWNPVRDWFNAKFMQVNHAIGFWEPFKVGRLHRRYPGPLDQGVAGAAIPRQAGTTRIAVIGDYGDSNARDAVKVASLVREMRPAAVATLGDNVYPTGSERDWQRGFDPPELYGELVKSTPFHPSLGNHDYDSADLRPYFRRFPHLQGQPYYTWTSGNTQFFVLDTEQRLDAASAQYAWLGAQLAQSTAPMRVVYMHRPLYSSAGSEQPPAWRPALTALMARHGVRLVLAGHEHSYERTQPIDGITYIVAGGSGAPIYPFRTSPAEWTAFRSRRPHFLEVEQRSDGLVVRATDDDGRVFDTTFVSIDGSR